MSQKKTYTHPHLIGHKPNVPTDQKLYLPGGCVNWRGRLRHYIIRDRKAS